MGKCDICGKSFNSARKYSYRGSQCTKRVKTMQRSNVKKLKIIDKGTTKTVSVCTRCIRAQKVKRAI